MRPLSFIALLGSLMLCAASARASDTDAARAELKVGYELRQAGRCTEAMPHFLAALRLDPSAAKALLNLSDCEARGADLVSARAHAVQGRDLARNQGNADLEGVADEQLAAIEKRLPGVTIVLAATAPSGVTVTQDGTALAASSLGNPIPMNPGAHALLVDAPGHAQRHYDLSLPEGAHQRVEVDVGRVLAGPVTAPPVETQSTASDGSAQRTVGLVLGGAGLVGLVIGGVFGLISETTYSNARCPSCAVVPQQAYDQATVSTVAFVAGAVLAAGGAALYFTSPRARVAVGTNGAALAVQGAW